MLLLSEFLFCVRFGSDIRTFGCFLLTGRAAVGQIAEDSPEKMSAFFHFSTRTT